MPQWSQSPLDSQKERSETWWRDKAQRNVSSVLSNGKRRSFRRLALTSMECWRNSLMSSKTYSPTLCQRDVPPKGTLCMRFAQRRVLNPLSRPPYRLGPIEQDEMEEQMKDLLSQGFIRPNASPYGVPILFVPQKDGRWCMCIDCRALNKQTIKDQFLLPRMDSLMERLG